MYLEAVLWHNNVYDMFSIHYVMFWRIQKTLKLPNPRCHLHSNIWAMPDALRRSLNTRVIILGSILLSYCYNSSRICSTFAMTPKSIMKLNFLLSFVIHSVLTKDFFCFWNGYLQHQSEDIFHFHFIIIVKAFYCILNY